MNEPKVTMVVGDVEIRHNVMLVFYVQVSMTTNEFNVIKADNDKIQKYLAPKIEHELSNYIYTDREVSP